MVCSLVWWKGCDDAIRILRRLDSRSHLVFCGRGPERSRLEALARQEGVAERVHFAGVLNDARVAYAAMDAFLFLSRFEPFGLVIAEAMAAGVRVFGLGGEGEYREACYPLVTDANACFVERRRLAEYRAAEDPDVLDELAQKIAAFAQHPESHQPGIRNAGLWVRSYFDIPAYAKNLSELYRVMVHGMLKGVR